MMRHGQVKEAMQTVEKAATENPENKAARRILADLYNEHGEPQKSIDLYSLLIQQDPQDYNLYNSRGYAYGRMGLADKALEDYNQALSINPDYVNAISNRAALYIRSGQMELAQNDYERLVSFDPAQGNLGLGNVAASNKEWTKALDYFDKAITNAPDFAQAYMMRGQVFLQQGENEKAAENLKQAQDLGMVLPSDLQSVVKASGAPLETQPQTAAPLTDQPAGENLSQPQVNGVDEALVKAYDLLMKKDTAAAIPILNKIIESDPANYLAYHYRGWCLDSEQKYDEALKDYFKVVELNPQEGRKIIKSIAFVYMAKNNFAQASSRFDEYLRDYPDDGEAQYNLAIADFKQNYWDGSLKNLDKAEQLGVQDSEGLRAMIQVAKMEQENRSAQVQQAAKEEYQQEMDRIKSDFKRSSSPWKMLASIVASLVFGVIILVARSKGQPQPAKGQDVLAAPLTVEGIFDRDRFFFNRKISVTEKYYVLDEAGQPILFVEKPIMVRNALASVVGIFVAVFLFILGFIAFLPMFSSESDSAGPMLLVGLVSAIISILGAVLTMSAMEKKRRVSIYRDETKTEKVLEIQQDSRFIVIRTSYTLTDHRDIVLAKFRRNHFVDFFRRKIKCLRPQGNLWFFAKEDSGWLSLLRRILPLEGFGFIVPTNYDVMHGDTSHKIGEFNRTSAILDKHVLDLSLDPGKSLDRKVALACAVLLDINI